MRQRSLLKSTNWSMAMSSGHVESQYLVGSGSSLANVENALSLTANPDFSAAIGIHPHDVARMSDADLAKSGITAGTVRLSIGLESSADLIEDLDRALNVAAKQAAAKA